MYGHYHGKDDWWDESDWRSYIPIASAIAYRKQNERDAKKAKEAASKAEKGQIKSQGELDKAQKDYQEFMANLRAREAQQAEHQAQAERARKFEVGVRNQIGMDSETLSTLYNTQQQLAEEQIELYQQSVDTTQQGGIPDTKFPWGIALAFVAIAGGIYYYRS